MHDPASELPRIPLLRTRVNKGEKRARTCNTARLRSRCRGGTEEPSHRTFIADSSPPANMRGIGRYVGRKDGRKMERLTVSEAAERLGISEGAVRKRVQRGTLAHGKQPDGRVYVV